MIIKTEKSYLISYKELAKLLGIKEEITYISTDLMKNTIEIKLRGE